MNEAHGEATFLANHVHRIAACDFFTVPTVTFRVLYVFLVLRHDRRHVAHFNVTTSPTVRWAAQQIVNAFPLDQAPRFLLRDRDGIYGKDLAIGSSTWVSSRCSSRRAVLGRIRTRSG